LRNKEPAGFNGESLIMTIAHSKPYLGKEELDAARAVVLSGQLAQGALVERLETDLAKFAGHRYGVALSSGTAALYCALRGLGAGPGDDVVIPAYVCAALLNAVVMAGARPVLSDVDPITGNLTPELVKRRLTKKTKAIIVPHMFGYPAPVPAIGRLGVPVIEDCAQCVGARIGGKSVGALSTIAIFSFYATKMIAAGEGGMVATSDRGVKERIIGLREYDKRESWTPSFNFKLSDLHASLALAQLKKLSEMVRLRRAIAQGYRTAFSGQGGIQLPPMERGVEPVYYRFVVRLTRAIGPVIKALREKAIECGTPVYKPLHRYLKQPGFPNADALQKSSLSLPMHPGLSKKDVEFAARQVLNLTGQNQ
jgi:perosamine synthetase